MTDKNPHIVKEPEGEAYTIRQFVTGVPIDATTPDIHGVYPVSPLGFLNGTDSEGNPVQLGEARPTSFLVTELSTPPADADCFTVTGEYSNMRGTSVNFPVKSITTSGDTYTVVVDGDLPEGNYVIYFENVTSDDYTETGLVGSDFTPAISGNTVQFTASITFAGTVGEGKLRLCVRTGKTYVKVVDNPDTGLEGYYLPGSTPDSEWTKVCSLAEEQDQDDTPDCHARNGYSDSEVADWVSGKLSGMYDYAVHPMGEEHGLDGAGALVRWFVNGGDVDVSGGAGKETVMVPGFGLGSGYGGQSAGNTVERGESPAEPGEEALRPMLTFGYGTKNDAWADDVGKTALPLDWPFTDYSGYAENTNENNITLSRKGMTVSGHVLGALERDSNEPCGACHATGVVPAESTDAGKQPCLNCGGTPGDTSCTRCHGTGYVKQCPDCNGTGYSLTAKKLVMDRAHLCLFNDFKTRDDGSTVLKKTFVNLAAPIDTKDGEEMELTVSLPVINPDQAYAGSGLKNLSAYYAYVSQPRVYVVGGTWKFAGNRVKVVDLAGDVLTIDAPFADGNVEVPQGAEVRFDIHIPGRRKTYNCIGTANGTNITLTTHDDLPGLAGAYICGAAYVADNAEDLLGTGKGSPEENLGLNAARTEDGELGPETGSGESGALDEFNRFYTADGESPRHRAVDPEKDGGQVVATVYPTVTNTFPWSITHRRKIRYLDHLMTMDAETGFYSLFNRMVRANKKILDRTNGMIPEDEGSYQFSPEAYPVRVDGISQAYPQSAEYSVIGAIVNLLHDGSRSPANQPVRQAIRAVKMLADDLNRVRFRSGALSMAGAKVKNMGDSSTVGSDWDLGTLAGLPGNGDNAELAQAIRLSHIPPVLATPGTNGDGSPVSEDVGAYPYANLDAPYGAYPGVEYYSSNPYSYGEYSSSGELDDSGCDLINRKLEDRNYSNNSIVKACSEMGWVGSTDKYDELLRAAELAAIDLGYMGEDVPRADADVRLPDALRSSPNTWLEAVDAFAKIVSHDSIPAINPVGLDYSSSFYDANIDQLMFISGDAYWHYRLSNDWAYGEFLSTRLPTDDAEAKFLSEYVPCYGAAMPARSWDSYRVKVASAHAVDDPVYLTRMAWSDGCMTDTARGTYAADTFYVDSADESLDTNMNRLEFGSVEKSIVTDWSVPPFTQRNFWSNGALGDKNSAPSTYTRVFMKFTFSADEGRWFCTDYRQAPTSYLSPLYGAQALEQTISDKRVWIPPACGTFDWKDAMYHRYGEYRPYDINPELVPEVCGSHPYRIAYPYKSVADGGLGLSAPLDKDGSRETGSYAENQEHANFWSVRAHLRPATGAISYGDIPSYSDGTYGESGGVVSDSTLWGQFSYPAKGVTEYHLPDTVSPDADLTVRHMVYALPNEFGVVMAGDLVVGGVNDTVISASYGEGRE